MGSKYRPVGYHPRGGDPWKRTGNQKHAPGVVILAAVAVCIVLAVGITAMVVFTRIGSHLATDPAQWGTQ